MYYWVDSKIHYRIFCRIHYRICYRVYYRIDGVCRCFGGFRVSRLGPEVHGDSDGRGRDKLRDIGAQRFRV